MACLKIQVPNHLIFPGSIEFVNSFKAENSYDEYVFDFQNHTRIDPFSIVYVGSEIKYFRDRNSEKNFTLKNYDQCTYAAHMGFFQSFGANWGEIPGGSPMKQHIPLTLISTLFVRDHCKTHYINPGEYFTDDSRRISEILTQNNNDESNEILTYCLREIFRNITEHSYSYTFGYCGQYYPSRKIVQFVIADRGVGIRKSLSENPNLIFDNTIDALKECLNPGISSKVYKGQKRKQKGEWANSGFGLYMTSNLISNFGKMFVGSFDKALTIENNIRTEVDIDFNGTIICIEMKVDTENKLSNMLEALRDSLPPENRTVSKSTMSLKSVSAK